MNLSAVPPSETSQAEGVVEKQPTEFREGYSIILPSGFQQASRKEYEGGNIVYRFHGEERCQMTFAVISDEALHRFSAPPQKYSDALVKSVPELSEGIDGDILAERVSADGMPATFFRFFEKETYRGVVFTYYMVAMDRGTKLVLKIAGKYGGYDENEKNIVMPDHWYDSMLTLKHIRGR